MGKLHFLKKKTAQRSVGVHSKQSSLRGALLLSVKEISVVELCLEIFCNPEKKTIKGFYTRYVVVCVLIALVDGCSTPPRQRLPGRSSVTAEVTWVLSPCFLQHSMQSLL